MRVEAAVAALLVFSGAASAAAQVDLEVRPRLSSVMVPDYPGDVVPFFADLSTYGGCSVAYLPMPPAGCALIRDEPATLRLAVHWTGASPLRLMPAGVSLVTLLPRRAPEGVTAWPVAVRWVGPEPERNADGSFTVSDTRGLDFRIDLSGLSRSLPAGEYTLCFRPNLLPPPGIRWDDRDECYAFELIENDSVASRLELLRRRGVDALARYDCKGTLAAADQMLGVDPASAVAYRLRAAAAELERRHADAVAALMEASNLLRTWGDNTLALIPEYRLQLADGLDDRRIGIQLASGISLLGPDQTWICR